MTTPSRLIQSREARRGRVIDAVLELASEGGSDAVQLREIARRSGVSLRTIYAYYGSRDELLLAAMVEWRRSSYEQSVLRVHGASRADRVVSIYRHSFAQFELDPLRLQAFTEVIQRGGWAAFTRVGREIVSPAVAAELADLGDSFRADFAVIIDNVLFATLTRYGAGQLSIEKAWSQVERTIRRLLA